MSLTLWKASTPSRAQRRGRSQVAARAAGRAARCDRSSRPVAAPRRPAPPRPRSCGRRGHGLAGWRTFAIGPARPRPTHVLRLLVVVLVQIVEDQDRPVRPLEGFDFQRHLVAGDRCRSSPMPRMGASSRHAKNHAFPGHGARLSLGVNTRPTDSQQAEQCQAAAGLVLRDNSCSVASSDNSKAAGARRPEKSGRVCAPGAPP